MIEDLRSLAQDMLEQICHQQGWHDEATWILDVAQASALAAVENRLCDKPSGWSKILAAIKGSFPKVNRTTKREIAETLSRNNILTKLRSAAKGRFGYQPTKGLTPWKVFVSSPVGGLERYRNAVQTVLQDREILLLRCEIMGASGKSPYEKCLEWARKCGTYILLLGQRYGSVPEGESKSVTELEFDEARRQDPNKILIYLIKTATREQKQQEFIQRINDFRSGYFRREVGNTSQLLNYVISDISENIAERAKKNTRKQ